MTRRTPYRCGQCGGLSLLQPKHNTIAALIMLAIVGVCALSLPILGFPKTIAYFFGLYVFVVGGAIWFFMRLEPVKP